MIRGSTGSHRSLKFGFGLVFFNVGSSRYKIQNKNKGNEQKVTFVSYNKVLQSKYTASWWFDKSKFDCDDKFWVIKSLVY